MAPEPSILKSIKKLLGVPDAHTEFDEDIIMHINSAFFTLKQIWAGPVEGFKITGTDEQWVTFIGDNIDLEAVKTYIYLKVRLAFDPPQMSHHVRAIEAQIEQYEWRLNITGEETRWVDSRPLKRSIPFLE